MIKKKFTSTLIILILILTLILPSIGDTASAVESGIFTHWFDLKPEESIVQVDYYNESTTATIQYKDRWNWYKFPSILPQTWNPKNWFTNMHGPIEGSSFASDPVSLSTEFLDGKSEGWNVWLSENNFESYMGQTYKNITLYASIEGPISSRTKEVRINGVMGSNETGEIQHRGNCTIVLQALNFSKASLYTGSENNRKKVVSPNTIIRYPITIKNTGFLRDTYVFSTSFAEENQTGWKASTPQTVVLDPGETDTVYLNVWSPDVFYEPSDSKSITVHTYSETNLNNSLDTHTIAIESRGFYFSPLITLYISLAIIALIAVISVLYIYKKYYSRKQNENKKQKISKN